MAAHGISVGDVSIDIGKMMEGKTSKVDQLTGGIEYLCKKYKVRETVPCSTLVFSFDITGCLHIAASVVSRGNC